MFFFSSGSKCPEVIRPTVEGQNTQYKNKTTKQWRRALLFTFDEKIDELSPRNLDVGVPVVDHLTSPQPVLVKIYIR